jgi:ABC-type bacteriocin/lantibiotic exporter with double-glycine peptidase domain
LDLKAIKKSFVRQHDRSDCGVACLLSIIRYFGGEEKPERLRELSGTTKNGTRLSGLYQASGHIGLITEGMEADMEYLKRITNPVILHITTGNNLKHYVVCHGFSNNKFIIVNPEAGVEEYTCEKMEAIWRSKVLLTVIPGNNFINKKQTRIKKIKWIKELVKDDITIFSVMLLLGIVISVLGIVMAVFSQKLVDDILPGGKREKLIVGLMLVTALLFIRGGLSFIHRFFSIKQGRDFNLRIINFFYSNLLRLPKTFFDNRRTGDLVARLNDTAVIRQTITYIINTLIINVLVLLVSGTVIFFYSFTAGLITLSSLPVFLIIAYIYHDKIVTGQRNVMECHSKNESNYINSIQGIEIIKNTNNETLFSHLNKLIYGFYQDAIFRLGKVNINLGFLIDITGIVFIITLLTVNSYMVINKSMSIGTLVAISGISSTIFPAIASLAFSNIHLQGARIAFDRMFEFTGLKKEYSLKTESCKIYLDRISSISFSNISFRFPGRKHLFKNISFTASYGEMITLFGHSGCGKTTILNLLQKFYYPDNGTYLINNIDASKISVPNLRNTIAVVPQETVFFNGTVADNICIANKNNGIDDIKKFCKRFGFDRYFEQFPLGYNTPLGEDGINISGGQQQLVSIARALCRNPQVLLLDEPSSNMDRETEGFIINLLGRLKKESIIIVVTHKISTAKESDRIYVIDEGEIQKTGNHRDLLSSANIYSMAYNEIVSLIE